MVWEKQEESYYTPLAKTLHEMAGPLQVALSLSQIAQEAGYLPMSEISQLNSELLKLRQLFFEIKKHIPTNFSLDLTSTNNINRTGFKYDYDDANATTNPENQST